MQDTTNGLLLGYRGETSVSPRIGFHHAVPDTQSGLRPPQEIRLAGDAPLWVVGRTGSGKGVSSLIPTALTCPNPMVVVDVKAECAQVTADARRRMGHTVYMLDPWGYAAETTDSLNPIDLIGDPRSNPAALDDAAVLAEALVPDLTQDDRFWDVSVRHAVAAILLQLAAYAPPELRTLRTLHAVLGSGMGQPLAAMLAAGLRSDLGAGYVARQAEALATTPDKTLASILAVAAAHLAPLASPAAHRSTARSTIPLAAIERGDPITIFMIVPPERLRSHAKLLRAWLNVIFAVIGRRRVRPPQPTVLLIDEVAQLGPLEQLRTASFLLRGYGLQTVCYLQTMDQLAELYRHDWRALLHNAGAVLALSGGDGLRKLIHEVAGPAAAAHPPVLGPDQAAVIMEHEVTVIRRLNYLTEPQYQAVAGQNRLFGHGAHDGR